MTMNMSEVVFIQVLTITQGDMMATTSHKEKQTEEQSG